MSKRSTTEEFIEKARKVHGDKYDYSKVNYINEHTKVIIVCPIHGDFLQQPNSHLSKRNCPKCVNRKLTTEEFIKKAKEVHGNKYDYTCTEYINKRTKVKILCKQCNKIFEIFPFNHILNKHGCPCQRPRSKSENNIV